MLLGWDLRCRVFDPKFAFARSLVGFGSLESIGESLVENAGFGSLDCHFWRKSRAKRSFWKLGLSLLVKVSWKMLVLEACLVCKSVLTWEKKQTQPEDERIEIIKPEKLGRQGGSDSVAIL